MALNRRPAKKSALTVLKLVTKLIAGMSDDEIEALASGRASLRIAFNERTDGASGKHKSDTETLGLANLRDDLERLDSTEAGFEVLKNASLTRSELEQFARSLQLAVLKQDSMQRLEEKLVEALIGSRLNSRAIRGK